METKLNIAEILKDKPQGTKLYDLLCNMSVKLNTISTTETIVWCSNKTDNKTTRLCCYSEFGTVRGCPDGLQILKPSKSMQDWSKFAWKKGDVLVSEGTGRLHVIFEGFNDDTYTTFKGKHYICDYDDEEEYNEEEYNDYNKEVNERTFEYKKDKDDAAQTYINTLEKRLGGKLNLETLEIEKQPEFKDGDVLCVIDNSDDYHYTLIYKGQDNEHIYRYVTMFEDNSLHIRKDAHLTKPKDYSIRYATKEEKQELFDSLAKEGKAWDAEKKQIVNIKKEPQFKPFEKVLVRDSCDDVWRASFFSHIKEDDGRYVTTCVTWKFCIPYEGNEQLLGTTKDVED